MKGISPIIASVLLIAITMSIAVVLAAYVTTYTREATESIPSACIGGALFFRTGSPTYADSTTCEITAGIEAQFVDLNGFVIQTDSGGVITSQPTTGTSSLSAGDAGTVYADLGSLPCPSVDYVRVTTANCFNVRAGWTAPTSI